VNSVALDHAYRVVLQHGPDRVVINGEGEAVPSKRARCDYGVVPEIVFIRGDGWALGAPRVWEAIAYSCWQSEWIGFARRGDAHATPISDY
jgi:hypothetical protein